MVIDTSALVAIVLAEPPKGALLDAIENAAFRTVSSVSVLEAGMVLRARVGSGGVEELYGALKELSVSTVAFDAAQAERAIAAFSRFGKGMGHRAQLNFGDCAVYALASISGEPLLATGNDFAATDLQLAPY